MHHQQLLTTQASEDGIYSTTKDQPLITHYNCGTTENDGGVARLSRCVAVTCVGDAADHEPASFLQLAEKLKVLLYDETTTTTTTTTNHNIHLSDPKRAYDELDCETDEGHAQLHLSTRTERLCECQRIALEVCRQCTNRNMLRKVLTRLAHTVEAHESNMLAHLVPTDATNPSDTLTSTACLVHHLTEVVDSSKQTCRTALRPLLTLWKRTFRSQPFPCDQVFDTIGVSVDQQSVCNVPSEQIVVVCKEYVELTRVFLQHGAETRLGRFRSSNKVVLSRSSMHYEELHDMLSSWQESRLPFGSVPGHIARQCAHAFELLPPGCAHHADSLQELLQFLECVVNVEVRYQKLVWTVSRESTDVPYRKHIDQVMAKLVKHFRIYTPIADGTALRPPSPSPSLDGESESRVSIPAHLQSRGVFWKSLYDAFLTMNLDTVKSHHDLFFAKWQDPEQELHSTHVYRILRRTDTFQLRNRLQLFFDYATVAFQEVGLEPQMVVAFFKFVHTIFSWTVEKRMGGMECSGFDVAPKMMQRFGKRLVAKLRRAHGVDVAGNAPSPPPLHADAHERFRRIYRWLNHIAEDITFGEHRWLVWCSCAMQLPDTDSLVRDHVEQWVHPSIVTGRFNLVAEDTYLVEALEVNNGLYSMATRRLRDLISQWHRMLVEMASQQQPRIGVFTVHTSHWPEPPRHPHVRLHPLLQTAVDTRLKEYYSEHPGLSFDANWWLSQTECQFVWQSDGRGQCGPRIDPKCCVRLESAQMSPEQTRLFTTHSCDYPEDTCIICTDKLNSPCENEQCTTSVADHRTDETHVPCASIGTGPVCRGACGHVFHSCCMEQWLKRTSTCPLCRVQWSLEQSMACPVPGPAVHREVVAAAHVDGLNTTTTTTTTTPAHDHPQMDLSVAFPMKHSHLSPPKQQQQYSNPPGGTGGTSGQLPPQLAKSPHTTVCVRGSLMLLNILLWVLHADNYEERGKGQAVEAACGTTYLQLKRVLFCSSVFRHTVACDMVLSFWIGVLEHSGLLKVCSATPQEVSTTSTLQPEQKIMFGTPDGGTSTSTSTSTRTRTPQHAQLVDLSPLTGPCVGHMCAHLQRGDVHAILTPLQPQPQTNPEEVEGGVERGSTGTWEQEPVSSTW